MFAVVPQTSSSTRLLALQPVMHPESDHLIVHNRYRFIQIEYLSALELKKNLVRTLGSLELGCSKSFPLEQFLYPLRPARCCTNFLCQYILSAC